MGGVAPTGAPHGARSQFASTPWGWVGDRTPRNVLRALVYSGKRRIRTLISNPMPHMTTRNDDPP